MTRAFVRATGFDWAHGAPRLRDHRPLRGRQGNADPRPARAGSRPRAVGVGDDPRAPDREEHGRDYHFLTPEEFAERADAGDFLEHATFSGNRYGTQRAEIERTLDAGTSVVLEIEVQGARQVRAAMGDEAVLIFIAPPSPEVLRERLAGRGTDSDEAIERRLETAKQELEALQEFKHVVVNDEIERASGELEEIVRDELGAQ